ncbi:MAG TPA: hypothetical protein VGW40_14570 [Allosphingosinicella sp.]|nr:hypothetical protein [Allosphingosinicella sp.]
MTGPGETLVFVGIPGEGRPDPRAAAAAELGAAALALVAAAAFAWYRARRRPGAAPRRLVRVVLAAAAFTLAFLARDAAWWIVSHDRRTWLWVREDLAGPAAAFGFGAALLFAFADWVLARLDARRNRGWLIAAPPLFAILVLAPLRLTWLPDEIWLASYAACGLCGAAAGLVWWALLPPGETQVARAFD